MDSKSKGYQYELQVLEYIRFVIGKEAYLWTETPVNILVKYGIIGSHNEARLIRKENVENPLIDTGIDIIQIDSETECTLIQCKNGYKKGLTFEDLAGFWGWMLAMEDKKGVVYYTDKLSKNITMLKENSRIKYISCARTI